MTYEDIINKIKSIQKFGSKPGLSRIQKLLKMIGNPQDKLKYIHVAGTNGKGSVCAFMSSILIEAKYKVGLYTSPSITSFRERIKINDKMISQQELCDLFTDFEDILNHEEFKNDPITEFELITAMAFKFFFDKKCDIVVLETGLGGGLDATNIIKNPLCSVITSISLDHTQILGDTVKKIAKEKFGIIKPNCPVVLGPYISSSVAAIAHKKSQKMNSHVYFSKIADIKNVNYSLYGGTSFTYENSKLCTHLIGRHQISNLATVLQVIKAIKNKVNIPNIAVLSGIKKTKLTCRLEIASENPLIILDGAHNIDGAKYLKQFIDDYLNNRRIVGIVGMLKDKDYNSVIKILAPMLSKIITVSPINTRALSLHELTNTVKKYTHNVEKSDSVTCAIGQALNFCQNDDVIIIFGSFSIMSEAKSAIKNL